MTSKLIVAIPIMLCAISIVQTILLIKKNKGLTARVAKLEGELENKKTMVELYQKQLQKKNIFDKDLGKAEITTKLQVPRLATEKTHLASGPQRSGVTEKYSLIRTLVSKGMAKEDIASMASVSALEIEQILRLSKLSDTSNPELKTAT